MDGLPFNLIYNGDVMEKHKVIIIGAGPAGMAAAIQLKRYGIIPLVIEAKRAGGLLWNANLVENYPGFPGGIPGPALVAGMVRHFEGHGLDIVQETARSVDFQQGWFKVETNKADHAAQMLVLATGTKPKQFPAEMIPEEAKERVSYEVSDLSRVRDEQVLVVGGGDAAFDYALNLAQLNEVVIANRGSEIKALPLLQERVSANQRIRYMENTSIKRIKLADDRLMIQLNVPEGTIELNCAYLLGAIGRTPAAPRLSGSVQQHLKQLQSASLLHIIGDLKNGIFRQTSIAVGDGVRAAMEIFIKMKEN
jgi:thioredoxin reductase